MTFKSGLGTPVDLEVGLLPLGSVPDTPPDLVVRLSAGSVVVTVKLIPVIPVLVVFEGLLRLRLRRLLRPWPSPWCSRPHWSVTFSTPLPVRPRRSGQGKHSMSSSLPQ